MSTDEEVQIKIDDTVQLAGTLTRPFDARGLVLFAHGSGSSRMSPRNRHVAQLLHQAGFATMLFDLLTAGEERLDRATGQLRFAIPFLASRLLQVTQWADAHEALRSLHIGYFGASTGAAAALVAAAEAPKQVFAVVSRGGRPDLAGKLLPEVEAPTLLIVGSEDREVLKLNEQARRLLRCTNAIEIVPGATHLFEEPGTLEEVALLASEWFQEYLPDTRRAIDLRV